MATDYGQKARQARKAAQRELAEALGLALSEVQVSYDGMRVHFSVDVLRRALADKAPQPRAYIAPSDCRSE